MFLGVLLWHTFTFSFKLFYFSWKSVFRINKNFQYFVVNSLPTLCLFYFNFFFRLSNTTFFFFWFLLTVWAVLSDHCLGPFMFCCPLWGLLRRSASLIPSLYSSHLLERWLYLQGKVLTRDFRLFFNHWNNYCIFFC